MDIKVKRLTAYRKVEIVHDNVTIDLGMLSNAECKLLSEEFRQAFEELERDYP